MSLAPILICTTLAALVFFAQANDDPHSNDRLVDMFAELSKTSLKAFEDCISSQNAFHGALCSGIVARPNGENCLLYEQRQTVENCREIYDRMKAAQLTKVESLFAVLSSKCEKSCECETSNLDNPNDPRVVPVVHNDLQAYVKYTCLKKAMGFLMSQCDYGVLQTKMDCVSHMPKRAFDICNGFSE